jgi:type IV pilus biogenesis protein PilP
MDISALATRCRYCGEMVGRPKEASREITVDDLGGEQQAHYVPSSNVMDALESFRLDEVEGQEAAPQEGKGRKGKKGAKEGAGPQGGRPGGTIASLQMPKRPKPVAPMVQRPSTPLWLKVAYVAGAFALVAGLAFGGWLGYDLVFGRADPGPATPGARNPVPDMLADPDVNVLEALEVAIRFEDQTGLPRDREIALVARSKLAEEVRNLLNDRSFTPTKLRQAAALAAAAYEIDKSQIIRLLNEEVQRELSAYRIMVREIRGSGSGRQAVIALAGSQAGEEVTVTEGDLFLGDKFRVRSITNSKVRLVDSERGNRTVTLEENSSFVGPA